MIASRHPMTIRHDTHERIEPRARGHSSDAPSLTRVADAALELAQAIACGLGVILLMAAVYTILI